jgi:hypothetical protein
MASFLRKRGLPRTNSVPAVHFSGSVSAEHPRFGRHRAAGPQGQAMQRLAQTPSRNSNCRSGNSLGLRNPDTHQPVGRGIQKPINLSVGATGQDIGARSRAAFRNRAHRDERRVCVNTGRKMLNDSPRRDSRWTRSRCAKNKERSTRGLCLSRFEPIRGQHAYLVRPANMASRAVVCIVFGPRNSVLNKTRPGAKYSQAPVFSQCRGLH